MIDKALKLLRERVESYIRTHDSELLQTLGESNKLFLGNLLDSEGKPVQDKPMILTLTNIEEERIGKTMGKVMHYENPQDKAKGVKLINPEIKLNLYVLFTAHFDSYELSLRFISSVIGYFQTENVITNKNSNPTDQQLLRLIPELYSIPVEQLNYLWSTLGSKYVPSVLYKIRLITIQNVDIAQIPITDTITHEKTEFILQNITDKKPVQQPMPPSDSTTNG